MTKRILHLISSFLITLLFVLFITSRAHAAVPTWGTGVVSVHFDDAYLSTYTQAAPLMSRFNIKGTLYVNPEDQDNGEAGHMSWQQVQDMQNTYGWEVGNHAYSHVDLTTLPADQVRSQITQGKDALSAHGINAESFASPFGAYNNTVMSEAAKLHTSHRTAWSIPNSWPFNNYELKAVMVKKTMTANDIDALVTQAKANNQWLILVFHDLKDTPTDDFDYSLQTFKLVLRNLQVSGVTLSTTKEVINSWGKGANLVANGSFEAGTGEDATSWVRNPVTNVKVVSTNTGVFPNPLRSTIIDINNIATDSSMTSTAFTINPAKKYRIKLFGRFNSYTGGDGSVRVNQYNSSNVLIGTQTLGGLNSINLGTRYFDYTPQAGTAKVEVSIVGNQLSAFNFEFDGVEMKEQ